ncbi:MAG: nitroreductase family protein [Bacteroidota bacterium]
MPIINKNTPTDHDILELLQDRWSPRAFKPDPIPGEQIHQMLEAARWAASSYNAQPWRFIYAQQGTPAFAKINDTLVPGNQAWAEKAPLLLLCAMKKDFDNGKPNFHAMYDLGQAVANLSTQAQALGIALHQMAGLDRRKAAEVFQIPDTFEVITAIAAGYYGGDLSLLPERMQAAEERGRERLAVREFSAEGQWPG